MVGSVKLVKSSTGSASVSAGDTYCMMNERKVAWDYILGVQSPYHIALARFPGATATRLRPRLRVPRGVLAQPFNQRLQHQTQHRRNMLSVLKKSGRRSHTGSSTNLDQQICEHYYPSYSSYFHPTHRSASSSCSPQSCLIGADRRAGRHCDERD